MQLIFGLQCTSLRKHIKETCSDKPANNNLLDNMYKLLLLSKDSNKKHIPLYP